jgi:hypothetical protein
VVLAIFTVVAVALAIFASTLLGVVFLAVGCVLQLTLAKRSPAADR